MAQHREQGADAESSGGDPRQHDETSIGRGSTGEEIRTPSVTMGTNGGTFNKAPSWSTSGGRSSDESDTREHTGAHGSHGKRRKAS